MARTLTIAAILLPGLAFHAPLHAQGLQALLVVGNGASPSSADMAMSNRLVTLGFQVTMIGDAASQISDADGKSLVLTVSSVTSGSVRGKFATVAVPLFNSEQAVSDNDYRMSSGGQGTENSLTQISITNANHVLAAGLSGLVTVYTAANSFTYGTPNANAISIATIAANPARKCIYAYDTGVEMYAGVIAPARRIHFMLSDTTFSSLNTNGMKLFDAAIRWVADLSTQDNPPQITDLSPFDGAVFQPAITNIGFTATTHPANIIPANTNGIKIFLNGVDVSGALVISGTAANRTVVYTNDLAPNTLYTVQVVVKDNSARETVRTWHFDTIVAASAVAIEAENFNFDGGGYINNPVLSTDLNDTNTYNGKGSVNGISEVDYHELNSATRPAGGVIGEWRYAGATDNPQTLDSQDSVRSIYATNVSGIPDFDLVNVVSNEWWNYTHDFTSGNYQVYLRAKASIDQAVELDRVTGDRTQPNQSTILLGNFNIPNDPIYGFVPLIQPNGAQTVLNLAGTRTLRLLALTANNDLNLNYIVLVPTTNAPTVIGPYVQSVSPANGSTSARRDSISATITDREATVNTNTIQLFVDGVLVGGLTVVPTLTGADVSYAVSPPFAASSTHTASLRFSDNLANLSSNTWSFTTSPDALPVFTAPRMENGELKLLVAFAQPVEATTAGEVANYTSDRGVTFSAATILADRVVELTGTPVIEGPPYLLTIKNVQDLLGNVVPDTSISYNVSPFLSTNGFVMFEAESYHTNTAGEAPHAGQTWAFNTTFAGYSGAGSMLNPGGGNVALADFATGARMDYRVRFTQPGTYKMWIRATETSAADSIFYGLDGQYIAAVTGIAVGSFNWNDDPEDAPTTGTNHFTIATAGDYTINIWVREDGMPLDKIMIVQESADFDPGNLNGGLGPNQSQRAENVVIPGQPALQFSRTASGLTFDWTGAGFHLQQATNIANPQWSDVLNGDTLPVDVPFTGPQQFFRLISQ